MNQDRLGLLGLAAAAEVIAAACRFNAWVATDVKRINHGEDIRDVADWWIRFLDHHEVADKKCRVAMAKFITEGSEPAFCEEMAQVTAALNDRSLERFNLNP